MPRDLLNASDAELLHWSRESEDAFAVFYRRHERLVAGWLVARTRSSELAADLTAEVFAAAFVGAHRFHDGPEPAGPWLLGIARHKLLGSLRRQRIDTSARRRLALEPVSITDESLAAIDELRDCGVLALLDGLPADQRDAIRARVVDETDYADLAVRLQVSPASARKRVSRGLAALRRLIQQGEHP